jgi:hypothetical protein
MGYALAAVGVVFVILIARYVSKRGRIYKRVFADEHFLEIARRVAALKAGALERIDDQEGLADPRTDPRAMITGAPLVFVYTINTDGSNYDHQLSVSVPGYTAHAVGDMFLRWALELLDVDLDDCELVILPSTVHFVHWRYGAEQQARFVARPLAEADKARLAEFRQARRTSGVSNRWRRQIRRGA